MWLSSSDHSWVAAILGLDSEQGNIRIDGYLTGKPVMVFISDSTGRCSKRSRGAASIARQIHGSSVGVCDTMSVRQSGRDFIFLVWNGATLEQLLHAAEAISQHLADHLWSLTMCWMANEFESQEARRSIESVLASLPQHVASYPRVCIVWAEKTRFWDYKEQQDDLQVFVDTCGPHLKSVCCKHGFLLHDAALELANLRIARGHVDIHDGLLLRDLILAWVDETSRMEVRQTLPMTVIAPRSVSPPPTLAAQRFCAASRSSASSISSCRRSC